VVRSPGQRTHRAHWRSLSARRPRSTSWPRQPSRRRP
jgi:hypothetical protein